MSDDGVALTSISHPRDERLIERVARAICAADGVDPDDEGYGLGTRMPLGVPTFLWEARVAQAIAAIEAYDAWNYELAERGIDPAALEDVVITIGEDK
jgi:hypothetical protein